MKENIKNKSVDDVQLSQHDETDALFNNEEEWVEYEYEKFSFLNYEQNRF